MPCRPTFEEIAWSQMTQTERECLATLDHRWPELTVTDLLPIVDMLVEAGAPVDSPAELERARVEARALMKSGREVPSFYPQTDLSRLDSTVAFLRDLMARVELCLCILETQLAVWQRDGILRTYGLADDPSVRSLLASHLAHRRTELHAALEAAAHDPARRARLAAISDTALCCDRSALC